jgi:hypothetical protein
MRSGRLADKQSSATRDTRHATKFSKVPLIVIMYGKFTRALTFENLYQLYKTFAEGAVLCALNGFNACVLAYGQTGSGKTYSLFGPPGWLHQLRRGIQTLTHSLSHARTHTRTHTNSLSRRGRSGRQPRHRAAQRLRAAESGSADARGGSGPDFGICAVSASVPRGSHVPRMRQRSHPPLWYAHVSKGFRV